MTKTNAMARENDEEFRFEQRRENDLLDKFLADAGKLADDCYAALVNVGMDRRYTMELIQVRLEGLAKVWEDKQD